MKQPDVVTVANEKVSIVTVCQMLGVDLPDDVSTARSRKVHCPFGEIYHSDHGASAAMRVYPETNSAYCFSCTAYYTPVALAAKALDIDRRSAAVHLLDRIGYRPLDLAQVFRQAQEYEPEPDKALMADALKTYCRRIDSRWSARQFDPVVAMALTRCLGLLDLVRSADDVRLWLCRCKEVMRRTLRVEEVSSRTSYEVALGTIADNGSRRT